MKRRICWLFSLLLCFTPLSVLANDELILGGNSIGIEIHYGGVYVSGTYPLAEGIDPAKVFRPGDIIVEAAGQPVQSIDQFYEILRAYQETTNTIPVVIRRGEQTLHSEMQTVYDAKKHTMTCGLYVKDRMSGIGTMTYYDPVTKRYGALGHEIEGVPQDMDGSIYNANVVSFIKAQNNQAGEKQAQIAYDEMIGGIDENTPIGIYGHYTALPDEPIEIPWAKHEEAKLGKAVIYTVLEGQSIKAYDITITALHPKTADNMKGIEFIVDDTKLLNATGGIIQGMSGSPIVQDGKLIGAVTHVVTASPSQGYGVFVEWMLQHTRSA